MVRKRNSFGRSMEGVARERGKVVAICRFTRHLLDGISGKACMRCLYDGPAYNEIKKVPGKVRFGRHLPGGESGRAQQEEPLEQVWL